MCTILCILLYNYEPFYRFKRSSNSYVIEFVCFTKDYFTLLKHFFAFQEVRSSTSCLSVVNLCGSLHRIQIQGCG